MKITFAEDGWSEYLYWQTQDKKTVNYGGIEYSGAQYDDEELQEGWGDDGVYTYQCRNFYRVPKGYDGFIVGIFNPAAASASEWADIENKYEIAKENGDTILFRLK